MIVLFNNVQALADELGVKVPNCESCELLEKESDEYGYKMYHYCEDPRSNLRSFPFKKPQACWCPSIHWADNIEEIKDGDWNWPECKRFGAICDKYRIGEKQ